MGFVVVAERFAEALRTPGMEQTDVEIAAPKGDAAKLSPWEWLPAAAFACLIPLYLMAEPGGLAARFAFFVGLGLLPGVVWRLLGKSSWNVHRIGFAAGLVAFVLDNPELRPDAGTWRKIIDNWHLAALGFLVSFTQPVWGALRTRRLLNDTGVPIGFLGALKLILIGSFFNIFLPGSTGGDAYRVYAVTRDYQTRLSSAIASISLDRFLGLPSLILVVLLGMALDHKFFLANKTLSSLVPFITGAGAVCLILVLYLLFAGWSHRRPDSRTQADDGQEKGWLGRLHRTLATNVKRPATLPLALFYGFMSHIACIVSCLLFGLALSVQGVEPLRYFLIVPMAMTINAIPGAPGGVGQGELAMATLLDWAGPGHGNLQLGVMVMLLFRLSNMAIGLGGGALYAFGRESGKWR